MGRRQCGRFGCSWRLAPELRRALRDSCRLHCRVFGLVNEFAAHPLRFERVGASLDPRFFVADAVRALFVLLFLSANHNNVGLDLPVGVDQSSDSVEILCRKFLFGA